MGSLALEVRETMDAKGKEFSLLPLLICLCLCVGFDLAVALPAKAFVPVAWEARIAPRASLLEFALVADTDIAFSQPASNADAFAGLVVNVIQLALLLRPLGRTQRAGAEIFWITLLGDSQVAHLAQALARIAGVAGISPWPRTHPLAAIAPPDITQAGPASLTDALTRFIVTAIQLPLFLLALRRAGGADVEKFRVMLPPAILKASLADPDFCNRIPVAQWFWLLLVRRT